MIPVDFCPDYNVTDSNIFEAASYSDKQYCSRLKVTNGTLTFDSRSRIARTSLNHRNSEAHSDRLKVSDLVLGSSGMNTRVTWIMHRLLRCSCALCIKFYARR